MAHQNYGSDLQRGNTNDYSTASAWASVGCTQSVTPPNPSVSFETVPSCINAATRFLEKVPGDIDPGNMSYSILYEAGDGGEAIEALAEPGCWRIKLGDTGDYYTFNGYFSTAGVGEITSNGFLVHNCGVEASGAPAITNEAGDITAGGPDMEESESSD